MRPDLPWFCRFTQPRGRVVAYAATALIVGATAACSSSSSTSSPPAAGSSSGGSSSAPASKSPIVIGASLSFKGDFAGDGVAFQKGYQLWAADVNAKGGLLGRQVKLDILNDNSDPSQVATNYTTLISAHHDDMVFGPFSSKLTTPSATVAARYGYAMIEGAGGAPTVFNSAANLSVHNVFDVSLPIAGQFVPWLNWIASLPAGQRPKTAAYPMADDPFADPPVQFAQQKLEALGVKTVYSKVFPAEVASYKAQADLVAATHADVVVLGSTDVPTVAAFTQAFEQQHYSPKMFMCASGPDQGATFLSAVGKQNADGLMTANSWYPGYPKASSQALVQEYVAKYGGKPSDMNADVAEGYAVGEIAAQAIIATGGTDQAKIIQYLHSGVTLDSVQGPVKFDSIGENLAAAAFVYQWQGHGTAFNQVLPVGATGTVPITATKPNWGG